MSQDEIMGHARRFPPSSRNFDSEASLETNPWSLASEKKQERRLPLPDWPGGGGRGVESRCGQRGAQQGHPPAQAAPRERGGGARLPGMGEEVCSDLASASPASRPQRRVWEDPRGSPKRVRVPDIYSLPGHQTCGPAHAPPGQDRGS